MVMVMTVMVLEVVDMTKQLYKKRRERNRKKKKHWERGIEHQGRTRKGFGEESPTQNKLEPRSYLARATKEDENRGKWEGKKKKTNRRPSA
jgi:hypothetical protein